MSDMSKGLSLTLNTDEWVKQLDDNQREGRELERAAIVAWLRDLRVDAGENITTGEADRLADVADWIEHGDHLRSDDDQQV